MTYIYGEVRRELYENRIKKPLLKRLFSKDFYKLYKKRALLLFIGQIVFVIIIFIAAIKALESVWIWGSLIAVVFLMIVSEIWGEGRYNKENRRNELEQMRLEHTKYIQNVQSILKDYGIDTIQKRTLLKKECQDRLLKHSEEKKTVTANIEKLFIIMPLSALIGIAISKDEGSVIGIVVMLIIGGALMALNLIVKGLKYLYIGYYKDAYLLDVIHELEYLEEENCGQ